MVPQVKQDPDAATPYIKTDPDDKDAVLADINDEDLYEDAGDLDFSSAGQNVWLSRLPRSLWEYWSRLDDDEEIQIGTVRIEGPPNDIKRVRLPFFPSGALRVFVVKTLIETRSACESTNEKITRTFRRTISSSAKPSTTKTSPILHRTHTSLLKRTSPVTKTEWSSLARRGRRFMNR